MSPHSDTHRANTIFIICGLTRLMIEPMIYLTPGEHCKPLQASTRTITVKHTNHYNRAHESLQSSTRIITVEHTDHYNRAHEPLQSSTRTITSERAKLLQGSTRTIAALNMFSIHILFFNYKVQY